MKNALLGGNVLFAALNLYAGVNAVLQSDYSASTVAFNFAVALSCSLATVIIAVRK